MTAQTVDTTPELLSSRGADVRQEIDGSRWYGGNSYSEELLASVTTVISACSSRPWLTRWAAKLAAEFAVEQHDLVTRTIASAGDQAAIDLIKGAAKRKRDEASERGTFVHDVVEAWVLGSALPGNTDEPEIQPYALAFLDWLIDWEPEVLAAEATVANPADGWAGTLDLIVWFPRWPDLGVWEIDVKSGANLDWSMPVQLGTYRQATEVWLPMGRKAPMPRIDCCAILHLRPEGAKMIDVTAHAGPEAYQHFLQMLDLTQRRDALPSKPGRVLYPPLPDGSQPPPMLEDLDGIPGCAALIKGGIVRQDQLAAATADELAALAGIGPQSLLGIRDYLHSQGLPYEHLTDACDLIVAKAAKAAERKAAKLAALEQVAS